MASSFTCTSLYTFPVTFYKHSIVNGPWLMNQRLWERLSCKCSKCPPLVQLTAHRENSKHSLDPWYFCQTLYPTRNLIRGRGLGTNPAQRTESTHKHIRILYMHVGKIDAKNQYSGRVATIYAKLQMVAQNTTVSSLEICNEVFIIILVIVITIATTTYQELCVDVS